MNVFVKKFRYWNDFWRFYHFRDAAATAAFKILDPSPLLFPLWHKSPLHIPNNQFFKFLAIFKQMTSLVRLGPSDLQLADGKCTITLQLLQFSAGFNNYEK